MSAITKTAPPALLRQALAAPEIVVYPAIFDALSARIAQEVGFKTVLLGGYSMAASLGLVQPLYSLEELVRITRYVSDFNDIPIMVDAGAGFGEPLHVVRAVQQLEKAGASGIHIEDQAYPKRAHYHIGIEHLVSAEEMCAKIRAACNARRNHDVVIVARTDAVHVYGYEEGVRRANLYREAGADVIRISPQTLEQARTAPRDVPAPVVWGAPPGNPKGRPVMSAAEAQALGYRCISWSQIALVNSVRAMTEGLTNLYNGDPGDASHYSEYKGRIEKLLDIESMLKLEGATVEH